MLRGFFAVAGKRLARILLCAGVAPMDRAPRWSTSGSAHLLTGLSNWIVGARRVRVQVPPPDHQPHTSAAGFRGGMGRSAVCRPFAAATPAAWRSSPPTAAPRRC